MRSTAGSVLAVSSTVPVVARTMVPSRGRRIPALPVVISPLLFLQNLGCRLVVDILEPVRSQGDAHDVVDLPVVFFHMEIHVSHMFE